MILCGIDEVETNITTTVTAEISHSYPAKIQIFTNISFEFWMWIFFLKYQQFFARLGFIYGCKNTISQTANGYRTHCTDLHRYESDWSAPFPKKRDERIKSREKNNCSQKHLTHSQYSMQHPHSISSTISSSSSKNSFFSHLCQYL